jgi:cyclohexanone monooxygenase
MRLLQRPDQRRVQGDLLLELIDYLRDKKISRIEAQPKAQEAWRELIADIWAIALFPRAKSWYRGTNVPARWSRA